MRLNITSRAGGIKNPIVTGDGYHEPPRRTEPGTGTLRVPVSNAPPRSRAGAWTG